MRRDDGRTDQEVRQQLQDVETATRDSNPHIFYLPVRWQSDRIERRGSSPAAVDGQGTLF